MSIIEKIENAMVNENKEELEKLLKIWNWGVDNWSTLWEKKDIIKKREVQNYESCYYWICNN